MTIDDAERYGMDSRGILFRRVVVECPPWVSQGYDRASHRTHLWITIGWWDDCLAVVNDFMAS